MSSSSVKETRSQGTARVTSAVASWLWSKGSRTIVSEVGLSKTAGLGTPWERKWRVDLVATLNKSVYVIEVKGSTADITREDLGKGKWIIDYQRLGLCPWLAVADTVTAKHYEHLPRAWGVMSVSGHRLKVLRDPVDVDAPNNVHQHLARVLTLQSFPILMGLNAARRALVMSHKTDRPWSLWMDKEDTSPRVEGPGNIL